METKIVEIVIDKIQAPNSTGGMQTFIVTRDAVPIFSSPDYRQAYEFAFRRAELIRQAENIPVRVFVAYRTIE